MDASGMMIERDESRTRLGYPGDNSLLGKGYTKGYASTPQG